ncbi:MAG: CARDB domain-containing protein [Thermodesulfobacteriota bacterium]
MFIRAMTIFAFSLCLLSCATQAPPQPPLASSPSFPQPEPQPEPQPVLLPDLTISDLSLNETGKIVVRISNLGKGAAPYGVGTLAIYIDGRLAWKDSLGTLPDQTFLQPGRFILFTAPVELIGRHEVRAIIDDEEKIAEENEENNVLVKLLGEEKREVKPLLPDLTVTQLFLNPQRKLAVTIVNIGDSPLSLAGGNLKILVDGSLKGSYTLGSLSDQFLLPTKGSLTLITPLSIIGRHEVDAHVTLPPEAKESNEENNSLMKILDGPPIGPDIVVSDLDLTEDFELVILLANAGELDLRKGVTVRIRIFVNGRKISDFEHFVSEPLKAKFGNQHLIDPPYRVTLAGISKVRVSVSPRFPSDDVRLENNVLERAFIIFPFKIGPQGREEFSFSFYTTRPWGEGQTEKVKAEARWEGEATSLMLSFRKSGTFKGSPSLSGRGPLKVEFPVFFEETQKESFWSIVVTNPLEKKVEGHLIVQHP